jgi:hypothetical protein
MSKVVYYLVLIGLVLSTVGCAQVNSLAVESDENAMACVKGKTSPFPGIGGSGIMIDLGKTDTTEYTAQDWKDLAEICD